MEKEQLMKLAKRLLAAHNPSDESILDRFHITKNELIKGVFCPKCGAVPMAKGRRKWMCSMCNHGSTDAYLPALYDYKLLIGDRISNQAAREFLQVDSPHIVKRLLQSGSVSWTGYKKARVYEL